MAKNHTDKDTLAPKEKVFAATTKDTFKKTKDKTSFHITNLLRTRKRRIIALILGILVILAILFGIPFTRYFILGTVVNKDVSVKVVDSRTKQPVSNATVLVHGVSAQSDKDGVAKLDNVPVSNSGVEVTKEYYEGFKGDYTVPVVFSPTSPTIELVATGRQTLVSIINKITQDPVENIEVASNNTKATTNSEGKATLILPANTTVLEATLRGDGYNTTTVQLEVDDPNKVNDYSITPAGAVVFLSKATGKINVVKTNLDGTNSQTIVAGTGQENDYATTLLSARDWQYSTLKATRTDNKERLYLVDNAKNEFITMDEGNATFELIGWSGHNFIYIVNRSNITASQEKKYALKSFNADSKKITTLDETIAYGNAPYYFQSEYFASVYILADELVYLKPWHVYSVAQTNESSLVSINLTNNSKKILKKFPTYSSVYAKLYEPQELYIRTQTDQNVIDYFEYEDKTFKTASVNDNKFNEQYPTFLISPSGNKVFWYESRDGKQNLFIGNQNAEDETTIGVSPEFVPYGWFGANDSYILVSKNSSELYISSARKPIDDKYQPLKITDYHKTQGYPGYGYGYGGQ